MPKYITDSLEISSDENNLYKKSHSQKNLDE